MKIQFHNLVPLSVFSSSNFSNIIMPALFNSPSNLKSLIDSKTLGSVFYQKSLLGEFRDFLIQTLNFRLLLEDRSPMNKIPVSHQLSSDSFGPSL